jgi:hypothetical protein
MSTALNLVYQYRQLLGKCDSSAGLDFEEIEALTTIESFFARQDPSASSELWSCRREFIRENVDIEAWLRGKRLNDRVKIVNLGPGGMVCDHGPYVEEGQTLEIVIDDAELSLSYRFKAEVTWHRPDANDDYTIGLRLVGTPVLVHYGPQPKRVDTERNDTVVDDTVVDAAAA